MRQSDVRPSRAWTLECRGITVGPPGSPRLREVSLTIRAGETLSIIGPNGAGKTTLLHCLLGLLPPTRGEVRLDGRSIAQISARERGRFAAYVPQFADRLPGLTVHDVVAGGRFPHARPLMPLSREDDAAIDRAIELCGLAELARRSVTDISGGERQKTLLAAAIAQDASLLLLDEPDTALDPAYQIELVGLLRRLRDEGRTLVIISHDLQFPAALGGRVVALRGGGVIADGPADELLAPERLEMIYGAAFERATTAGGRTWAIPRW